MTIPSDPVPAEVYNFLGYLHAELVDSPFLARENLSMLDPAKASRLDRALRDAIDRRTLSLLTFERKTGLGITTEDSLYAFLDRFYRYVFLGENIDLEVPDD